MSAGRGMASGSDTFWLLKILSRTVPEERQGKESHGSGQGENGCSRSGGKEENILL